MVKNVSGAQANATTNNEVSIADKAMLTSLLRKEYASVIVGGRERNSYVTVGEARYEPVLNKAGRTVTVRRAGTVKTQPLGWMMHPLLDYASPDWRISKVTYDRVDESPSNYCNTTIAQHTLASTRGEGTVFYDLNNEDGTHMSQEQLYAIFGIVEKFRVPAKWGKRVSSTFSMQFKPGQNGIFAPGTIQYVESPLLDEKTWDGALAISRADFNRLILMFQHKPGTPQSILDASVKELVQYNRFQFRGLGNGLQYKGHLLVLDYLPDTGDITIYTHVGAGKREFGVTTVDFIGVQTIKGHDHMDLDRQSLINLWHFFGVNNLVKWLEEERELVIEAIRTNQVAELLDRTGSIEKLSSLDKLDNWLLASYATAGGNVMWFASMVRQAGKTYRDKLGNGRIKDMRLPIPGGRQYVYTDSVFIDVIRVAYEYVGASERVVKALTLHYTHRFKLAPGTVRVMDEYSSIVVPVEDWEVISAISGGADQDDGYWIFAFMENGIRKILYWRSPNARGEYLVGIEDGQAFDRYSEMDSSKLPPRIDTLPNDWQELPAQEGITNFDSYNPYRLRKEIQRSVDTMGHLGMFVLATSYEAWLNETTRTLYRQEVVVDGTQKDGMDTGPALANVKAVIRQRVLNEKQPVSPLIYERIAWCFDGMTFEELVAEHHINVTNDSWLDHLMEAVKAQIDIFDAQLSELSKEAFPPVELFVAGQHFAKQGAELSGHYAATFRETRKGLSNDVPINWTPIRESMEKKLASYGDNAGNVLLGAAAHIYANSAEHDEAAKDSLLWLMGPNDTKQGGRKAGIGNLFIAMLQEIGLINEYHIVVDDDLYGHIEQSEFTVTKRPVALTITSAWYGLYLADHNNQDIQGRIDPSIKKQYVNKLETIAPKLNGAEIELRMEEVHGTMRLMAYSTRTNRKIGFVNSHIIPEEQLSGKKMVMRFTYFSRINSVLANLVCVCVHN